MIHRIAGGAAVFALLLVSSLNAADEALKSGPQVGDKATPKPFNPQHVNGPDAGKKVCLV